MLLFLQNYKKREFSPRFQQKNSRKTDPAAFEHMKLLMQSRVYIESVSITVLFKLPFSSMYSSP